MVNGIDIAHIRTYGEDDLAEVDALWRKAFPDDAAYNRAAASIPAKLLIQGYYLLVAVADGRIVGTAIGGYDGTRGWLYRVAVARAYRRRGIGVALVHAVEARLAAAGCVKLNLQVRDDNAAVVAFYQALGYAVEPRISMSKRLTGTGTSAP